MKKKQKQKLVNSAEITKQSIEQKMNAYNKAKKGPSYVRTRTSYTWHPHTQLFMSNWKQSHTKYECCARGDIFSAIAEFCVFFLLSFSLFFEQRKRCEKRETNEMYCFPIFRESFNKNPFFSSLRTTNVTSLCTASLKITIDNTQMPNETTRGEKTHNTNDSDQHLSLQIRVKIQLNELEKEN